MITRNNRRQIGWLFRNAARIFDKKSISFTGDPPGNCEIIETSRGHRDEGYFFEIFKKATKCSNEKGTKHDGKTENDNIFQRRKAKSSKNPPKVSENCLVLRKTLSRRKNFGFDGDSAYLVGKFLDILSDVKFAPRAPTVPPPLPGFPNAPALADSNAGRCPPCPTGGNACRPRASPPGGKDPPKPKYPPCPEYPTASEKRASEPKSAEKPSSSSGKECPEPKPKCVSVKLAPCPKKETPKPKPKCPAEKSASCSGKEAGKPEPKCPPEKPSPCSNKETPEAKPQCSPVKLAPCVDKETAKPERKPPPEKAQPCSSGRVIEKPSPPANCPGDTGEAKKCPPCGSAKKFSTFLRLAALLAAPNRGYSCSRSAGKRSGGCGTSKCASSPRVTGKKSIRENLYARYEKPAGESRKNWAKRGCESQGEKTQDSEEPSRK